MLRIWTAISEFGTQTFTTSEIVFVSKLPYQTVLYYLQAFAAEGFVEGWIEEPETWPRAGFTWRALKKAVDL